MRKSFDLNNLFYFYRFAFGNFIWDEYKNRYFNITSQSQFLFLYQFFYLLKILLGKI